MNYALILLRSSFDYFFVPFLVKYLVLTLAARYKNAKLRFLNIPNIHVMRDSLRKLHDLCTNSVSSSGWLSTLESTKWLDYISLILASAKRIAHLVYAGTNVVIHCSDGWDRTPQLSSLAMLMLDGYYRTKKGFAVLVEKEWLSTGHKFQDRCGHMFPWNESETSPVFLQFLDCVHQMVKQFPCAFEFTLELLAYLHDHATAGIYGTFLCNSDLQRRELDLPRRSVSVWSYVLEKGRFVSPFYRHSSSEHVNAPSEPLLPSSHVKDLSFWREYFLRYDLDSILATRVAESPGTVMQSEIEKLEAKLEEKERFFEKQLQNLGVAPERASAGEEGKSDTDRDSSSADEGRDGVGGGESETSNEEAQAGTPVTNERGPTKSSGGEDGAMKEGEEQSAPQPSKAAPLPPPKAHKKPPKVPPPMSFNYFEMEELIREKVTKEMEAKMEARVNALVEERLQARASVRMGMGALSMRGVARDLLWGEEADSEDEDSTSLSDLSEGPDAE
eukprot:TRINITY_DN1512_c0_g1_i1.p1 TRINITY_DN1512_c0_g1~~TRINITY_DN1512_c0_g1_i1.p1  ORF type:complete len:502 (-),score=124.83 TRINITY_DN1512_c0_g1_i1:449-1954(-)